MRGPTHPAALALLGLPAWLYGRAVRWRNRRYDRPGASREAGLPVVSVGNLTVGGTGKTPIVAWLARRLGETSLKPAVVSRGYGGNAGRGPLLVSSGDGPGCTAAECGDEPFLLARSLPGVIVVVGSDRLAGAELARGQGADFVLLDDGFQHRRIARDLDIVLIDATNPFGNGRLLPAGLLREPLDGIRRAGAILITRSRGDESLDRIRREVRRHNSRAPILRAAHRPVGFVDSAARPAARPGRALAFCGIGNPDSFRADLESMDLELIGFRSFPDHHVYSNEELAELRRGAQRGEAVLVTTEKDLARLASPPGAADRGSLLALRIEAEIFEPDRLLALVGRSLDDKSPPVIRELRFLLEALVFGALLRLAAFVPRPVRRSAQRGDPVGNPG